MASRYFLAAALTLFLPGPAIQAKDIVERFEYNVIPVAVAENVSIGVEVYFPKLPPRALVIVSPNSGGLSDPYFDQELAEAQYMPDKRGGLTEALVDAGFAVAFYSQRGFGLLASCVVGDNFQSRAASFVRSCVSTSIRARVTLRTITSDTAAVFNAFESNPRTRSLPKIALPYSEGMHHVSALAGKGLINVVGIVSVGGPRSSLARVWKYQMQGDHEFRVANSAFAECPEGILNLEQIFACAHVQPSLDAAARMRAFLGADSASRGMITPRREMMVQLYERALLHYAASDESEKMEGAFGGNYLEAAFSAHYYKEVFESRSSIVEQLENFKGRTRFLFGELDRLFPELEVDTLRKDQESAATMPNTSIIRGVGHGLEDRNGLPPVHALASIVQALNEVLQEPTRTE